MSDSYKIIESKDRRQPFNISLDGDGFIEVSFSEYVYAISFFQHGYKLQRLFEERILCRDNIDEALPVPFCNEFIIDFSRTMWFDTLALCYFFLFLYDSEEKYTGHQSVRFILPQSEVLGSFLVDNGFFYHMKHFDVNLKDDVSNVWENLRYSNIHKCFYRYEIIDSRTRIPEIVSNVQQRIENAYSCRGITERLEHLNNKISYFLNETLENVYDHAYPDENGKCGLLIKYVSCDTVLDYKNYSKNYASKTPYIDIKMYEDSTEFLELYVLDTGVGIKESFDPDSDITDSNIIEYVFDEGYRSHKKVKEKATRYGGLHDIRELFDQDADGLGIKADSVWKYVYRYSSSSSTRINLQTRYGTYDGLIRGFSLVAAVHLPPKLDRELDDALNIANLPQDAIVELYSRSHKGLEVLTSAKVHDERWGSTLEQEWVPGTIKKNNVVYPQAITTKSWITEKVYESICEKIIFMEIPDGEIKKYKTNITGIRLDETIVNTIILVTKSLRVVLLVRGKSEYFEESKESTISYISTPYVAQSTVSDSFIGLLLFDKYYNSWRFWNTAISKTSGSNAYVPKHILWSDEKELDGYLDFAQVNRMPECRDICIQKLNELRILKSATYFNSVDRFTDEICERANYIVGGIREGEHVNIGSVFVSGTSNRLVDDTNDCFYFLCHPDSDKKEIKTILGWLSKELLPREEDSEINSQEFQRLGNTSFVARGGARYWLSRHFRPSAKGFRLTSAELYSLIQRRIGVHPDTMRIGHFESTERHDLFGYRINYWFDSDAVDRQLNPTYSRESIYDYLMTNFIYALYGKVTKNEFMSILNPSLSQGKKEALWKKYYESDDKPQNKKDGILVYFYDFQTSMLIEKIENFLCKSSMHRIIPLIPMSRNYELGSLVVSPLSLDRIEEEINDIKIKSGEVNISVFDSVVFNVRLIEEVKQVMYGVGASKVKILTVLDRRRIPVIEMQPSLKALGRVDSPALLGNDKCTMCKALDKLERIKDEIINLDIRQHLSEIISRWQCIRISDNDYLKGIKANRINLSQSAAEIIALQCNEYWGGTLKIELDSALCSLVCEHAVVSASAQLLTELLNADDILSDEDNGVSSDEIKMLLASTYLLLFSSNSVSNKQTAMIIDKLIDLLESQTRISLYSGLAVVTVCCIPDEFVKAVCEKYEMIEETYSCEWNNSINIDALLSRIVSLLSLRNQDNRSLYRNLEMATRCYLNGNQSKLECLYDIFMYSEKSYNNSHRHAFARIIDKSSATKRDYNNALEYTRKIRSILEEDKIYASLFHDRNSLESSKDSIIIKVDNALSKLTELTSFYKNSDEKNPELEKEVKEYVSDFIQSLVELNTQNLYLRTSAYAGSADENAIRSWLDCCKKIAETRVPGNPKADFLIDVQAVRADYDVGLDAVSYYEPNSRPWFYSFSDVTEEVINLMVDILQYQDGKLHRGKDSTYDGIITLLYHDRFVEIVFRNKSNERKSIKEISEIKKSKANRTSMLVFREFERMLSDENHSVKCFEWKYISCKVDYADDGDMEYEKVFQAAMKIPCISRGAYNGPDVFDNRR